VLSSARRPGDFSPTPHRSTISSGGTAAKNNL